MKFASSAAEQSASYGGAQRSNCSIRYETLPDFALHRAHAGADLEYGSEFLNVQLRGEFHSPDGFEELGLLRLGRRW
jgi:hypothetical protein